MKNILFLTNYASPYRVRFFDTLGADTELTVLFADRRESQTHRSGAWFEDSRGVYTHVQLTKKIATLREKNLCVDVIPWLKKPWDHIVLCGYASPTVMLAMAWLHMKGIPYWLEVDGGLIRQDSSRNYRFKRLLVGSAAGWLSTGKPTTDYLVHYGAKREKVMEYPFSSLSEKDLPAKPLTSEEKQTLRRELGLGEGKVILSIGQFIHRKGFDVLLKAAAKLQSGADIYIVGGEPTKEYINLYKELGLTNVHFLGFMKKEQLLKYYQASDLFVLPTREDIWGLVVNEAMSFALPVITTDRCVAGLSLIEDGKEGYIVPVGNADVLAEKMNQALSSDLAAMGAAAMEKVRPYTIENMAKTHLEIFENTTLR